MRFSHETLPQRIRFERDGAVDAVVDELRLLGAERTMLIATRSQTELAQQVCRSAPVAIWHQEVAMHVPLEVADRARRAAETQDADVLLCIGGGSTTGLAKAVALTTGLPIVAVPTSFSGSEATNVWGITEGGAKRTGVEPRVLPRSVVYDASLLVSLPVPLSVASSLNALAHCVDSMWAPRSNPVNRMFAGEAIRSISAGTLMVVADPDDVDGREQALYGSHLAAVAFASAGSGLHHKICHVLGGMFNLPHAETHAVILPHVLAFNSPNAPDAEARIAAAFGSPSAVDGLSAFYAAIRAPSSLRSLGMPEGGIEAAVQQIVRAAPPDNPTPVVEEAVEQLVRAAWLGSRAHPHD